MDTMPSRAARTAYVVITVLFWITVVVGALLVATRLFGLFQDSAVMTVPASASIEDVPLPEGFEIAGPMPVNADLPDPSTLQRAIAAVPIVAWWAFALGVLWLVRGVARSAAQGDPFQGSNVGRLRWLGLLFLVGYPLATIVAGYFTGLLFSDEVWTGGPLPAGGIETSFPVVVSAPAILAAVCLFALAQVFAYGARLREDVDATI